MSRVYVAECGFSITGSVADERCPVDPEPALSARPGTGRKAWRRAASVATKSCRKWKNAFVAAAAADLKQAGSAGVVAAGAAAPPARSRAGLMRSISRLARSATPSRSSKIPTAIAPPTSSDSATWPAQIQAGKIKTLLILGGNPAYDAPADLSFAQADRQRCRPRFGSACTKTRPRSVCKWHLPRAHYLESWGDARSWDGTAGIVQPLIEPLYGGKSTIEFWRCSPVIRC